MSQIELPHGVSTDAESVHVVHGVYSISLPLAGWTIARVRQELAGRMDIDPDAIAVVEGAEADESTVLAPGQVLNFVRRAGEMG
ncbi:MAG: hypothetical protein KY475_12570 [Planctomycetes bacterium]|nr:hypothetical protein [Planctomycetota bacterium]